MTTTSNLSTLFALLFLLSACNSENYQPPFQASGMIDGINIDWPTFTRKAPGSDNWPVTWGHDDRQYTSWGDGGGFNGTNREGRVSIGVASIEGGYPDFTGRNILGGKDSKSTPQFKGKSYGILAIDKKLYMWVSPGSGKQSYRESRLYYSNDLGLTWSAANWSFNRKDGIVNPTFCQFGIAYASARDEYVYIYANNIKDDTELKIQKPGEITLIRAPKASLLQKNTYEYFSGLDSEQKPMWAREYNQKLPVFSDDNGVGWNLSVSYNSGLERYFLITEHGVSFEGNIGIFDSPNPWGPWSTVYYGKFSPEKEIPQNTFFYNFSNKWLHNNGLKFILVFTGIKSNDSWNSVEGEFILAKP